MLRLLEWLLCGHVHDLETINQQRLDWYNDLGERGTGTRYYHRCKKCGRVRKVDCK